jgi:aryl-alcohol dehydrogenase-like predicted oxidoreductase
MAMTSSTFTIGGLLRVNRLGFGAMRLCGQPGNFGRYPRWEEGIALLRRARDLSVNLFDTAEAYGPGCNEELIADALYPYTDNDGNRIVIATKGGILKTSPTEIRANGNPAALRQSCEASLRRLRVDCIDLYQLHRPDPQVPWEDSVGAMADLKAAGKIRLVGVSNVSLEQLKAAQRIVPIASVQNRYNITEQNGNAVLDYCTQHEIAFFPWGPLAAQPFAPTAPLASASHSPEVDALAQQHVITPAQAALLWLVQRAPNIIAIPGTTNLLHLEENMAVLERCT